MDTGNNNLDDGDHVRTLQDINYVIEQAGEGCSVVLMGDMNSDLSRDTSHVRTIKHFLQENNLLSLWSKFECPFTYYHERVMNGQTIISKSGIDRFCVNSDILDSCFDAMPLSLAENLSNHSPIFMKLTCNPTMTQCTKSNESRDNMHPKPNPNGSRLLTHKNLLI